MFFLFGLGNPGLKYKYSLHNLGYLALDKFAEKYKVSFKTRLCNSRIAHLNLSHNQISLKEILLVKPYTYMNLSGKAVLCFKGKYRFKNEQMLVICDDLNLKRGYLKIKPRGSSGGHKGLQSIIDVLGTEEFPRLRIGIGPITFAQEAEKYLLKALPKQELLEYLKIVNKVIEVIEFYFEKGIEKTMSFYNRKKII